MDINSFDILLLFVLAIAVSLIIGFNVLYVVDKNLKDIKIKIPTCPVPNIYIKTNNGVLQKIETEIINSDLVDNNRKLINTSNNVSNNVSNNTLNNISNNTSNKTMNRRFNDGELNNVNVPQPVIENFTSLVNTNTNTNTKTNTNTNTDTLAGLDLTEIKSNTNSQTLPVIMTANKNKDKLLFRQGYQNYDNKHPNTGDAITYPKESDVLLYNGYGCFKNVDDKSIRKVTTTPIQQPRCMANIKEDAYNKLTAKFYDNNVTSPIMQQYGQMYVPTVYMGGDPYMPGVSYSNLSLEIPADIDQIGSIPVNDYDGEPVPIGSFIYDDIRRNVT
jgi:hypothetical protein